MIEVLEQKDLAYALMVVADELANDVGLGLEARAATALDAAFGAEDIRHAAIRTLVDRARSIARSRAAEVERAATRARVKTEHPELSDDEVGRWPRATAEERKRTLEWAAGRRELDARNARETAGHVGPMRPGSWSKHNSCNDCQQCQEGWDELRVHEDKWRARRIEIQQGYENQLRAELFVEWTSALLGAEIAMPDGTRTTWGEATIEQHERRRAMSAGNAMANMENAARHAEAVDLLRQTGALNLNTALLTIHRTDSDL